MSSITTIPQAIITQATVYFVAIQEAERLYAEMSDAYVRIAKNRQSSVKDLQQAERNERNAWQLVKDAKKRRNAWLDGSHVTFIDSQVQNGEAARLLLSIQHDREMAYNWVEEMDYLNMVAAQLLPPWIVQIAS